MKETSRESDASTLEFLDGLKDEGKGIYDYTSHLPVLRNRLINGDTSIPKARNSLGRLVYESFVGDWEKIIPALSFIELSTTATYVLDDIIDDQPERQKDVSTWKKFGRNKGIIAGGLQTFLSFEALDKLDIPDSDKLRIYKLANNMWLKLWMGEGFNEEMREETTFDEYINRCYNISGVMFDTISQMSAICAKENDENIRTASDIGKNYGIAVMVRNDLADLLPKLREHSDALSKRTYEDIRKGIWTYPVIFAMENGKESDKRIIKKFLGKDFDNEEYFKLYTILKETGAIKATLDLITEYKEKANDNIRKLPESESKKLLFGFTELLENLRGYT